MTSTSKNNQVKVVKAADRQKLIDWSLLIKQADDQIRHAKMVLEKAEVAKQTILTMREYVLKQ